MNDQDKSQMPTGAVEVIDPREGLITVSRI